MRILLVHNFYRIEGGEETYVRSLYSLLAKNGHEVRLFKKDNKQIGAFAKEFFRIAVGLFRNTGVEKQLASEIDKFKPDIVHFNNIFPLIGPGAYRVCKSRGVPVVQTVHSIRYMFPYLYQEGGLTRYFYSLSVAFHRLLGSFAKIDTYIFPSKFARDFYLKRDALQRQKVVVIPNFASGNPKRGRKGKYFVYAGLISRGKGVQTILDAFTALPKEKLVVIGDTANSSLPRLYLKYPNIIFTGKIPNSRVYDYLSGAKALICASVSPEVFPTVILEAYSCGVGVIAPRWGVYKEMVKEGNTGFFFKKGNTNDLTRVVKTVSGNKNSYRHSALKEYTAKYTPERYWLAINKVYRRLTGHG
jgi:glycosyltransferase involved in cell wall biosynthesis